MDAEPKAITREEYGDIYQAARGRTIQFLRSCGAAPELAPDIAQSAWLRGWERLSQLRDPRMIVYWINSIALNQYRRTIRTECLFQEIRECDHGKSSLNLAAIDVALMLRACRPQDRLLLEAQLKGVTAKEIAREQGLTETAVRIRFLRARRSARTALQTRGVDLRNQTALAEA
ncbi:MAG: polymerase subunit sigma-70 [Bryobacterales bacterium]|nr:polymerase subunit sigma-70 [Bryobacterales bacterium]